MVPACGDHAHVVPPTSEGANHLGAFSVAVIQHRGRCAGGDLRLAQGWILQLSKMTCRSFSPAWRLTAWDH